MDKVNVFIVRRSGGSSLLWRNVPREVAVRLCSNPETASSSFMLVYSYAEVLGISPEGPVEDDGRFDHLLTDEEAAAILEYRDGRWVRKKGGEHVH